MYIHARVKGPAGSITMKPLYTRGVDETTMMKKADKQARERYAEVHGDYMPSKITVDLKVSKKAEA